jgi:hypothetical protein
MRDPNPRDGVTISVTLSADETLKLANALEAYPDAVSIHVNQETLTRRTYSFKADRAVIGTVDDGARYSDRMYEADVRLAELDYHGIVQISYLEAGLHLEQAPDEWTTLTCRYNWPSPALMSAYNYVPTWDTDVIARHTRERIARLLQRA